MGQVDFFKMMKISLILISILFFCIHALAQRVLIHSDSVIAITLDSTGYVEIHPQDIPDETGLFIYSANGREAFRIYGSFRLLFTWDDKQNFHPFDLTQPTIPTGINDSYYGNSSWTINMSRLGFDAIISSNKLGGLLIRSEFDWKGDTEKFRIRHLFIRSKNWLIGKSWSTFNNVAYLIQAVDGRFAGGAIGTRPVQLRYYNQSGKWKYQVSLEYLKPSLIQPDSVVAESSMVIPGLASNGSFKTDFVDIVLAGVLRMNRVQFTAGDKRSQSQLGYGGLIAAKLHLNKRNRLMSSAAAGVGIGGFMGDFAFVDIDLAYNPASQQFENMNAFTVFLGYEHDWSNDFTSAIGGSLLSSEEKSFFEDGIFIHGRKILTNLFYKPDWEKGNLQIGVEIEFAERKNINIASNSTFRASTLLIYNF